MWRQSFNDAAHKDGRYIFRPDTQWLKLNQQKVHPVMIVFWLLIGRKLCISLPCGLYSQTPAAIRCSDIPQTGMDFNMGPLALSP